MEVESITKQCENCLKQIAESKFALHEAYCFRNVRRCKLCNQPVDKSELEQHNLESHTQDPCLHCLELFNKDVLFDHQDNCSMKPKPPKTCDYCNIQVEESEFVQHMYVCGSRTRQCEFCQKNIIIREIEFHERFCEEDMQKKAIEESIAQQIKHNEKMEKEKNAFKAKQMKESEKIAMNEFNKQQEQRKQPFSKADKDVPQQPQNSIYPTKHSHISDKDSIIKKYSTNNIINKKPVPQNTKNSRDLIRQQPIQNSIVDRKAQANDRNIQTNNSKHSQLQKDNQELKNKLIQNSNNSKNIDIQQRNNPKPSINNNNINQKYQFVQNEDKQQKEIDDRKERQLKREAMKEQMKKMEREQNQGMEIERENNGESQISNQIQQQDNFQQFDNGVSYDEEMQKVIMASMNHQNQQQNQHDFGQQGGEGYNDDLELERAIQNSLKYR